MKHVLHVIYGIFSNEVRRYRLTFTSGIASSTEVHSHDPAGTIVVEWQAVVKLADGIDLMRVDID